MIPRALLILLALSMVACSDDPPRWQLHDIRPVDGNAMPDGSLIIDADFSPGDSRLSFDAALQYASFVVTNDAGEVVPGELTPLLDGRLLWRSQTPLASPDGQRRAYSLAYRFDNREMAARSGVDEAASDLHGEHAFTPVREAPPAPLPDVSILPSSTVELIEETVEVCCSFDEVACDDDACYECWDDYIYTTRLELAFSHDVEPLWQPYVTYAVRSDGVTSHHEASSGGQVAIHDFPDDGRSELCVQLTVTNVLSDARSSSRTICVPNATLSAPRFTADFDEFMCEAPPDEEEFYDEDSQAFDDEEDPAECSSQPSLPTTPLLAWFALGLVALRARRSR